MCHTQHYCVSDTQHLFHILKTLHNIQTFSRNTCILKTNKSQLSHTQHYCQIPQLPNVHIFLQRICLFMDPSSNAIQDVWKCFVTRDHWLIRCEGVTDCIGKHRWIVMELTGIVTAGYSVFKLDVSDDKILSLTIRLCWYPILCWYNLVPYKQAILHCNRIAFWDAMQCKYNQW